MTAGLRARCRLSVGCVASRRVVDSPEFERGAAAHQPITTTRGVAAPETNLRKDIVIAISGIVVVAAICFGLAFWKSDLKPFSVMHSTTAASKSAAGPDHVIISVNGDSITESEFSAAFSQLPEEMKAQYASEPGKQAFAEQMIRLKILEQEGHKLGIDKDPQVIGQLAADHTNIVAAATAQKLVPPPTNDAILKFYNENKGKFEATELSHILIAYQGGGVPARSGNAPTREAALKKAQMIEDQLKHGADFAKLATQYSDDTSSVERGGDLGPFTPGMLPPELEAHVAQLQPGQISEPVPSRYGVHIFKAGAHSTQPLEQVRQGITRRVQQQSTLDKVEQMRKAAKVDFDPKFFPEAPKPAAAKKPS
jgi:parvulin-like peptidyl-prolyl isomerase